MANLNERSKQNFLIYANSVIKSRAIPFAEDNLKPVHRRILYTLYLDKVFADKKTKKSATEVGRVMALNPHGDAAIYQALVRLSQPWKLRYPLIDIQGSNGNLLGDSAAASRYTECRLSKIGMLMLEDVDKECVDFKPNYDDTLTEPITLPSKFPYLLCGNNSGIAVGLSSDFVSHNFTEVMGAINHYLDNKDCTVADLMQFIKGPDFPTKGKIINGEELLNIYTTGQGSIKMVAHYDIQKNGNKTNIIFHDIPYGIDITSGVLAPLKKLVIEDGYDIFEDYYAECVNDEKQYYNITITLAKNADVAKALEILFAKTRLADTIKINQTVIINKEPKLLNLKELIAYWVNYRSGIIRRIALNDYQKTNQKLTVVLGLQKCMSDIDRVIYIVRNADSRAAAKSGLMREFTLSDIQADAVLDMKLSRLSKLDIQELDEDEKNLRETIARLNKTINDESSRYDIIREDLKQVKKVVGEDRRLTEIHYARPTEISNTIVSKEKYIITDCGVADTIDVPKNTVDIVMAYGVDDIFGYTSDGHIGPVNKTANIIGATVKNEECTKIVAVTALGNIKVSDINDYKWTKINDTLLKIKEGDQLVYAAFCSDEDSIMILSNDDKVLRLAISDLPVASKLTVGVKSGITQVIAASVVGNGDKLIFGNSAGQFKLTPVKEFNIDNRGNKGQTVCEGTQFMRKALDEVLDKMYLIHENRKPTAVAYNKLSIKSRLTSGVKLSTYNISKIV